MIYIRLLIPFASEQPLARPADERLCTPRYMASLRTRDANKTRLDSVTVSVDRWSVLVCKVGRLSILDPYRYL